MADFASQRRRNEAQRQARIKAKSYSSNSSGSSNSSSNNSVKSYVDPFGVIRREGGTGFSATDYQFATSQGRKSSFSGLPTIKGQPKVSVVEKPVFTLGTALRLTGKTPEQQSKAKFLTNKQGQVIGVEDPFKRMSYQLSRPVEKKQIQTIFQEQQLEKEAIDRKNKFFNRLETVRNSDFEKKRQKAIQEQPRLDKLESKYEKISKRLANSENARNTFKKYSGKVTDSLIKIGLLSPITKLAPAKVQNYVRDFYREISAIPYDFTVGAVRGIAGVVDQVTFQIQAVGIGGYWNEIINQLKLQNAPLSVAKSFDPRKPDGLANIVITLGMAKVIQNKRVRIREVKSLSKASNRSWKVGEIIKDNKGNYAVKTKGGRIFKVKANEINSILKANKKGFRIRSKKTQVARTVKKQLKGKITRAEGKILSKAQQKKIDLGITKEANKIARKFKLNSKETVEFRKLYSNFNKKPTLTNAKKLNKFGSKVSVDQVVRVIDRKIANRLKYTPKPKSPTKFDKSIKTLDKKIQRSLPKKKVKGKTLKTKLKELKGKQTSKMQKEKVRLDSNARAKGFKDAKEMVTHDKAFTEYKSGNLNAGKILDKIEKAMAKRKSKASKLASKRYEALRKDVIIEAKQFLKEGRIKIKDKKYARVKASRKMMSKAQAQSLAIRITQKYNKLENSKYNKQAREVLKSIIKGDTIEIQDPKLLSAIKRLINNQKLSLLRKERRLRIQAGLVKGKTPRSSLGKAKIKQLKQQSKVQTKLDRIARKKSKRSTFTGDAKSRKIYRKQILNELEREKNILKRLLEGDSDLAKKYILDIDNSGRTVLKPRTLISKSTRIRTANQILQKSKLPKNVIKTKNNGTIQLLKTKEIQTTNKLSPLKKLAIKKAELDRVWKSLKTKQVSKPLKNVLKRKVKINKRVSIRNLPKLKVLKRYSVATAIALESKLISKNKSVLVKANSILNKPVSALKPATINAIKSDITNEIKVTNDVISDIDNIIKSDVTTKQEIKLKQDQKVLTEQVVKLKRVLRKVNPKISEIIEIKKVKIPTWDDKLPKGKVLLVNIIVRSKGKNREIKLKTTPNRAYRYGKKLIDNTVSRSFQLKIVGVTKGKDIKKPSLSKFRLKKPRKSRVLSLVEKSKHAIDTKGERSGLSVAKAMKKNSYRQPKSRR